MLNLINKSLRDSQIQKKSSFYNDLSNNFDISSLNKKSQKESASSF